MDDSPLSILISDDIKTAMKSRDSLRLTTLRMLKAAIKQREIDQRTPQNDGDVLAIVNKMIKQRRESKAQFIAAERQELADKEALEITMLEHYLPEQLDETAIDQAIQTTIKESGASSVKDMGAVMATLKSKLQGQADMAQVSKKVRAILNP